jgi:hypothetical protein
MARSRDISKVLSSNTALATDAELSAYLLQSSASTTYQTKSSAGLTLINTTSFSAVSAVSLPTNTFTATYKNYQIIYNFTTATTNSAGGTVRLRAAGVDNSSTQYQVQRAQFTNTSTEVAINSSATGWEAAASVNASILNILICDPFETAITTAQLFFSTVPAVNTGNGFTGGRTTVTTSYDSLSYVAGTGNVTGTVRVYGWAN